MRIIILGAGRVGESVAESLVSERNDITVIDPDPQRLRELEERLDLRGVAGNGIHREVMKRAGADDADMLIACASLDETNLVACKVATDLFNIPTTIARLRTDDLQEGDALLAREGFAVDHVIRPEQSVVRYIRKLIDYPEALQVLEFSGGRVLLVAVRAAHGSPVVNQTIGEFRQLFPEAQMRLVALYRQERLLRCEGATRLLPGDEIFLLADREHVRAVLRAMHRSEQPVKRVMISGGGKVGLRLARMLAGEYQVKVIERDTKRCEYLACELPGDMLVLQGDGTDEELLSDENVEHVDMFLALTSDDEDNILSAMLAKRLGAQRVLALINRRAYVDLIQGSTIDIALSPAQTVIGELLTHVRRGDVQAVHSLRRGAAEALEGVARGDRRTSKLVGRRIEQVAWPAGVEVGAIVRGDGAAQQVLLPHHDTLIESDDHLVIFIPQKRQVREVERLFQVSATFL
ncbi:Trk system potassium transporter TrkA [Ramlibacter sp. USB13]|uniref:Trk system potassium uptake protein TrkA n=1 Tax=Ramlibacter cellulosilyticus TaxID=2764187 RepID=A0A923MPN8_9BURK|nr:Trk system potassium transporter TrkA [Ramlibacter cellulosilyticus]MBC5782616.1 Trk system potassium transporter TrkA [Ramlibacter cellulosilyticus]